MKNTDIKLFLLSFGLSAMGCQAKGSNKPFKQADKPNIVFILADDLGYGDVSCYNEKSKINTPNIDKLASQGVLFTDAHTSSSVCTPTRYSILTGRYNWRSTLKQAVLGGYSKALIPKGRETVASFLKANGYQTAAIGKWHLGWDWANVDAGNNNIDYSKPIANGPNTVGFDYFFGISGSLNMAPFVWVENDRPTMVPIKKTVSTVKQATWLNGLISDDFVHEQVLPEIKNKAVKYINEHAKNEKPFFLYLPLTAPHNPILPTAEFKGKSGLGNPYPDFVIMVDWVVAEVTNALKQQGISENTLVVFASDNGCSNTADFEQLATKDHFPSYIFRGCKADVYEGGHRVPFIVSWPDKIKSGKTDRLVCTTDFFATVAEIIGKNYPENVAEDSYSFVSALNLPSQSAKRESIVHHSVNGSFAYRKGNWKVCFCPGSGGWSDPKPNSPGIELLPPFQLFNLENDISEKNNLQDQYPKIVETFRKELSTIVNQGRSTKGKPQKNDGPATWPQLNWMDN